VLDFAPVPRSVAATPIDLAKASLIPLTVGFFTSVSYYSRFRVPALSLLSPQCVVTGLYVITAYGLLPWAVSAAASRFVTIRWLRMAAVFIAVFVIDAAALYQMQHPLGQLLEAAAVAAVLQILLLNRMERHKDLAPADYDWVVVSFGTVVVVILCCLHFAIFAFPYIPYYYAGGRPIPVYAIPTAESKSVLDDVFIDRKDRPALNPALPTYKMRLLCETSQDYYFLSDHTGTLTVNQQTANVVFGTIVSRVDRKSVARLDYSTPAILNLRELFK